MSDYTLVNETEHYNWGGTCEGWHLLKSQYLRVTKEKMPSGTSEILHMHRFAQQLFYVLNGLAGFEIQGKMYSFGPGDSVHIKPKMLHRIYNASTADLEFLVISEPDQKSDRLEIIDYDDAYKEDMKNLNFSWLQKYFRVEERDEYQLTNPKSEILDKGGLIYFVRFNAKICGTVSLMKVTDKIFELGKMAVSNEAQGLGIGQLLLDHCFHVAKNKQWEKLILYSNTSLSPAMHLYIKNHFYQVAMEPGHYERANIKMEKIIL